MNLFGRYNVPFKNMKFIFTLLASFLLLMVDFGIAKGKQDVLFDLLFKKTTYNFTDGESAKNIPFKMVINRILVMVKINDGEEVPFLLDTGASGNVLDNRFAESINIKCSGDFTAIGASGKEKASVCSVKKLSIGGLNIYNPKMYAIPLTDLIMRREGKRVVGLLGYDFIKEFVVEIDYENKNLSLYSSKSFNYNGNGTIIEMKIYNRTPFIFGVVEDYPEVKFRVDTGYGGSLTLHSPYVKSQRLFEVRKKVETYSWGVGGKSKSFLTRLKTFNIGLFSFYSVPVKLSTAKEGALSDPFLAGNLGGAILRKFKVIFDYSRSRIILEPNKEFKEPVIEDLSGLVIVFSDGFVVEEVIVSSPASRLGIKPNDKIIRVNEIPAEKLTLSNIRSILSSGIGEEIKLVIKRNEEIKEYTLILAKYF